MNLPRAIEINSSLLDGTYDHRDEDMENALRLGIEAMKRETECRENAPREEWLLLPGETEE